MSDADSRWSQFEGLGERAVRQNLALRFYGEDNRELAKAWLEHKASLSSAEIQAESLTLARAAQADASRAASAAERAASATEEASAAAKRQARAAESANRRATIAIAISAISIIVTIIIAIVGFRYAGAR